MESLEIQAFTYEQHRALLANLAIAVTDCGGWILDRRPLSPTRMEFCVEVQLRAILDLYAALIATGVELTHAGHQAFTHLYTRRTHLSLAADLGQTIALRLDLNFFAPVSIRSLLYARAGAA